MSDSGESIITFRRKVMTHTTLRDSCVIRYLLAPNGKLRINSSDHTQFECLPFSGEYIIAIKHIYHTIFALTKAGILYHFRVSDYCQPEIIDREVTEISATGDSMLVWMGFPECWSTMVMLILCFLSTSIARSRYPFGTYSHL